MGYDHEGRDRGGGDNGRGREGGGRVKIRWKPRYAKLERRFSERDGSETKLEGGNDK